MASRSQTGAADRRISRLQDVRGAFYEHGVAQSTGGSSHTGHDHERINSSKKIATCLRQQQNEFSDDGDHYWSSINFQIRKSNRHMPGSCFKGLGSCAGEHTDPTQSAFAAACLLGGLKRVQRSELTDEKRLLPGACLVPRISTVQSSPEVEHHLWKLARSVAGKIDKLNVATLLPPGLIRRDVSRQSVWPTPSL